ncbi:MAG TPA: tail fiber domain-containing protein, partial [Nevskia sp.]|nr:tail fiber domain-containing protein [Nevskia sp.]
ALRNATGSNNIGLGASAGMNLGSGSNNIDIGSAGLAADGNTIRIGTAGTQTAAYIAGISGVTVTGVPVLVSSTGQLGVQTSSARYKQDIAPMAEQSHKLMDLQPVTFHYKQDPQGDLQYGLLAEDVARVYPELAVKGDDGRIEAIRYQELTPMLLNEVQKQAQALQRKDAQIAALQQQNVALQAQFNEMQGKVAQVDALAARLGALEQRASLAGSMTVAAAGSAK